MKREKGRQLLPQLSLLASTVLVLSLAACNDLLNVKDVDVLTEDAIDDPAQLPMLRAAAIGQFAVAYNGGAGSVEGQILTSGLLADEFYHSGFSPQRNEVDQRRVSDINLVIDIVYTTLHQARGLAERAVAAFEEGDPGTTEHAEMHNLAGYTYLFFAENYCAGVPFSRIDASGALIHGEAETTTQILDRAQAHFSAALALNASAAMDHLASVGLGRARLDRGDFTGAAAAVTGVPTTFQYLIFHSVNTTRQNNGVFFGVNVAEHWSVAPNLGDTGEGGRGLNFRADPRVPNRRDPGNGVGNGSSVPQFHQLKYPQRNSSIPLADGLEARLIEAEAAHRAGNFVQALLILNTLRATQAPPGATLAPLADPGTANDRVDLLFRERAFWLWATAHRLGDLRRLIRQYGRTEDQVFPTGSYFRGGIYGDDVNLPIPRTEQNNPNSEGCLDRAA